MKKSLPSFYYFGMAICCHLKSGLTMFLLMAVAYGSTGDKLKDKKFASAIGVGGEAGLL